MSNQELQNKELSTEKGEGKSAELLREQ